MQKNSFHKQSLSSLEFYPGFSLNRINFSLLIPAILLVFISLATLFSIDKAFFYQQSVFFGISMVFYFLFLNIDYKVFSQYPKIVYAGIVILLISVLLLGESVNGARAWFNFFGVHLQPSEVIKPFFIIIIAHFLAELKVKPLVKYFLSFLIFLPIFFLIYKQPDLGMGIMYLGGLLGMLLMYGFPIRYYLLSLIIGILPLPFLYQFLANYQKERILTFFNTTSDPTGSSYNVIQALISIGSGGIFGKGLGEGTQSVLRFLPERHTDFIFASISEGLGFIGGMTVICLLCFFLYRLYAVSRRIESQFSYLIVIGFFFLFLTQILVNIGMNMGLVPVTGITLPFISYGGSSLLTSFIILGIISSITYEYKRNSKTLEII